MLRQSLPNSIFIPDFNAERTFNCGQAFRWLNHDGDRELWLGVVKGVLFEIRGQHITQILPCNREKSNFEDTVSSYFSFSDDLSKIKAQLPQDDPFLRVAMEQNSGLRILTQDPWECLISFVCSQNSNIVAIRSMIDKLSRNFGRKLGVHRGITFYSFPEAERLSRAKKRELMSCSVGFRWKYIKFVASKVATGELNLERLTRCDLQEIRNSLMSSVSDLTQGVGPKVADCFALFSAHRTEAFPIDIWILRCIRSRFSYELERAGLSGHFSLTPKRYFMISKLMRRKFGEYSGYAQQYLYSKVRSDSKKDGARALEQCSVTTR